MPTHGEMIDEVSKELPEPFRMKELADAIIKRYESVRDIERRSSKTDILGCCVNMKSHASLLHLPLVLISLRGRGKGRLFRHYNPATDRHANLYLGLEKKTKPFGTEGTDDMMLIAGHVRANYYDFNNAEKKLMEKGLLSEIHQIIKSVTKVDHRIIRETFGKKGWKTEYRIHHEVNWAWDAYKDRIPVSIELSLIDAMVYLTAIESRELKYENVERDLHIFSSLIKTPIPLIGLKSA